MEKHNQVIFSRFQYNITDEEYETIFDDYRKQFKNEYDSRGVQIGGASVAVAMEDPKYAVILTYSEEADVFLKLKFLGRKDVKYHHVCRFKGKKDE